MLIIVVTMISAVVIGGYYYYTAYHTSPVPSGASGESTPAGEPGANSDSGVPVFTSSGYYRIQIPGIGQVGVLLVDSEYSYKQNPNWSGMLKVGQYMTGDREMFAGIGFVVKREYCDEFEEKMGLEPGNFELTYVGFDGRSLSLDEDESYDENENIKNAVEDLRKVGGDMCLLASRFKPLNKDTGEEFRTGDILKFTVYWEGQELFRVEAPIDIKVEP